MEDTEAVQILKDMLKKYAFEGKEKEAILSAIGLMGWTKLIDSKIKDRKARRLKELGLE